ncbi:hypothetical protein SAMN05444362_102416 [Dysgonomonas macrotermitis]|uniref:Uncharacterized protein n=1 Tax=Dysgonomonas macrotermitis TaxID=1346286 RepID=A0A1M4X6G0_9BACT|nr:hypothetical protein SAMN05444362_102416 [Dysgonomonas macrotermitis]
MCKKKHYNRRLLNTMDSQHVKRDDELAANIREILR